VLRSEAMGGFPHGSFHAAVSVSKLAWGDALDVCATTTLFEPTRVDAWVSSIASSDLSLPYPVELLRRSTISLSAMRIRYQNAELSACRSLNHAASTKSLLRRSRGLTMDSPLANSSLGNVVTIFLNISDVPRNIRCEMPIRHVEDVIIDQHSDPVSGSYEIRGVGSPWRFDVTAID